MLADSFARGRLNMIDSSRPILVVDDDQAILTTVAEILTMEGYTVTTAINGVEALREVERACPMLVVLDMRMPILDGWGFSQELRRRGCDTPILVMTAAQDAGVWADQVGAAGYLAKPFDLMELLNAVEQLLQQHATSHPTTDDHHNPGQNGTSHATHGSTHGYQSQPAQDATPLSNRFS